MTARNLAIELQPASDAQRPITVFESVSAAATAAEIARLQGNY